MSRINDVIIEIAEMKLKGYTDEQIYLQLGCDKEWINSESVKRTMKALES